MKKIIVITVIAILVSASTALAITMYPQKAVDSVSLTNTHFETLGISVVRFSEGTSTPVCYLAKGYNSVSLSCVK